MKDQITDVINFLQLLDHFVNLDALIMQTYILQEQFNVFGFHYNHMSHTCIWAFFTLRFTTAAM